MQEQTFFAPCEPQSLSSLAQIVSGVIAAGDDNTKISGVAPIDSAKAGEITFLDNAKYVPQLIDCEASAVVISQKFADKVPAHVAALVVAQPYHAFAAIAAHLFPQSLRPMGAAPEENFGVHARAVVHETAQLGENVTVDACATIGANAQIGDNCHIHSGAVVGQSVSVGAGSSIGHNAVVQHALIGNDVIIHPNTSIGQDGFGFAPGPKHLKVPQLGRVIIQDCVEIGANTSIDRGTTRDTVIGEGTKIDNQVQIAHNCIVGRHCFLVSKVGLSGSTTLGDYVTFAGMASTIGHLEVGSFSQVAGMSAVTEDLPPKSRVGGVPAVPIKYYLQDMAKSRRRATQKERGKRNDDK